jgi:hypothetical protein
MVCTHRFKFRIHPHTPTDVSMYVPPHASWVGASASLRAPSHEVSDRDPAIEERDRWPQAAVSTASTTISSGP